ncbi:hypothetical protein [Sphingomonas sp.]|uniref:hypothetical protein n=1 Tax=Sphingomonas sp. TaxID=28214 RepID=UPI000DB2B651|nr:hypothetical protein [Sphingomonas sp.]PZU06527.1 MAG: hypothetical protein DI605_18985 [Sphingomonas sp.]
MTASAAVDGTYGFVLATRDPTHGLSFWSADYGYGPLFNATVFSEADAAAHAPAIADDQLEWLALPAPLVPRSER